MLNLKAKRTAVVLAALLGASCAEGSDAERGSQLDETSEAPPAAQIAGAATRASLEATIAALLEGLQRGDADAQLAVGARVTENGKELKLASSRLSKARSFPYRAFAAEPGARQAAIFGSAEVAALPIAFALRVKVDDAGAPSEVEIVTVRSGEFLFAAPTALTAPDVMYETTIPPAQQAQRAELVAIASSYFKGIEDATGATVPFSENCARFENGLQTTRNPVQHAVMALDCKAAMGTLGYIETIRDRRFPLVDVERGLVLALSLYDVPGGQYVAHVPNGPITLTFQPNTWHVAQVFKIVSGQIERVEGILSFAPLGTPTAWPAVSASPASSESPAI